MGDAAEDKSRAKQTVTLEVAYNCVYCGKPMFHDGDHQPSLGYAQCWKCWAESAVKQRDRLYRTLEQTTWFAGIVTVALFMALTYIVGFWP